MEILNRSLLLGLCLTMALARLAVRVGSDRTLLSKLIVDEEVGEESCGFFGFDVLIRPFPTGCYYGPISPPVPERSSMDSKSPIFERSTHWREGWGDSFDTGYQLGMGFDVEVRGTTVRLETANHLSE